MTQHIWMELRQCLATPNFENFREIHDWLSKAEGLLGPDEYKAMFAYVETHLSDWDDKYRSIIYANTPTWNNTNTKYHPQLPRFQLVRKLTGNMEFFSPSYIKSLCTSPYVRNLQSIDFQYVSFNTTSILFHWMGVMDCQLSSLTDLQLGTMGTSRTRSGANTLVHPVLPSLTSILLGGTLAESHELSHLFANPNLPQLKSLTCADLHFSATGVPLATAWRNNPNRVQLQRLSLLGFAWDRQLRELLSERNFCRDLQVLDLHLRDGYRVGFQGELNDLIAQGCFSCLEELRWQQGILSVTCVEDLHAMAKLLHALPNLKQLTLPRACPDELISAAKARNINLLLR